MFKNTFHQSGFLSLYYSLGSKPLQLWQTHEGKDDGGVIHDVVDPQIQSKCLEIASENISSCFISCPALNSRTLGIRLPYVNLVVKNLNKYFSFEVEVMDDKDTVRRFRISNFQEETRCQSFICTLPLRMEEDWNIIQVNLADLTKVAYGTLYAETRRITVNGSCRLRVLFFADNAYSQEQLPPELRLFIPNRERK
tara:strand:+ start:1284 stop:1871 length:588 start_codon:yes stop_codon:yes gene_type:complete